MKTREKDGPVYATRDDPNILTIQGKEIRAWIEGFYVSATARARDSQPVWAVEIDGVTRAGPSLDFQRDNDISRLHQTLTQWAVQHREFFNLDR